MANEIGLYPIEFQVRCIADNITTVSGECFYNPDLECWFVLHPHILNLTPQGEPITSASWWQVSEYSSGMRLGARAHNRNEAMRNYLDKVAPLNAESIRKHIERWGEPLNDIHNINVKHGGDA